MALSFLPLAVRSEQCRLTANAYTTAYSLPKNINLIPSQWTTQSSTVISYNWGVLGVDDSTFQATEFTFNCRPRDGVDYDKVYYTVYIRDANGTLIFQSRNVKANTTVKFTTNPYTIPYSQIAYRVELLVFMFDGSWLYRDDIVSSSLTLQLNCLEQVEENTLPSEWLTTVTNNIENPFETMTTIVPPEMAPEIITDIDLSPLVTIPEKITFAINMFLVTVGQLLQLKYMTFTISFILIVCLFAWLLH